MNIALVRVARWKPGEELDLGSLGLTELPPLPNDLEELHCYCNELTALPDTLPASLRILCCAGNDLVTLPTVLPPGLQQLNCAFNKLTALPSVLPASLEALNCYYNDLTTLPTVLPATLTHLDCGHNLLIALPAMLPTGLLALNCAFNGLTSLPDVPKTLTEFICDGNSLSPSHPDPGETPQEFLGRLRKEEERVGKERTLGRTALIKEELIAEVWAPWRLEKRLASGEELDAILA